MPNHSKREYKILLFDKENDKFFISDENSESLFPTRIKKGQIYFSNTFQNDEDDEKNNFNNKIFYQKNDTIVLCDYSINFYIKTTTPNIKLTLTLED